MGRALEPESTDPREEEICRLRRAVETSLDCAVEHVAALLWELPGGVDFVLQVERGGYVATVEPSHYRDDGAARG
jgi:hypothetical protein